MTPNEWSAIANRMKGLFPRSEFPAESVEAYFHELKGFGGDDVLRAVRRHAHGSTFAPSVHEIVTAIQANRRARGEGVPDVAEAWKWAVDGVGSFSRFDIADSVPPEAEMGRFRLAYRAVQAVGGFQAIDRHERPAWIHQRFEAVYGQLRESEESRQLAIGVGAAPQLGDDSAFGKLSGDVAKWLTGGT